ncbi:HNH endonuclease [Solibacillus sp. FSL H8-0538]|uniref:HNH endonuclease n=1 Tax=Solibacillus sp. FSL H8-0538 TaxID=2921400 RepID=UPI004046C78D
MYNNTCQICGTSFTLIDSISYSEVHHIQPHGTEHNGMDDLPNMIALCPNHHTLFDLGIIALDPMNPKRIIHIDEKSEIHNTELKVLEHEFSSVCVRFNYENIFIPLKQSLNV